MIRQIPGPLFLLYYRICVVLCILVGRLWVRGGESPNYTLPDLTHFDPIALSFLRGGQYAVIRTAVFDLWNRGLVTIDGKGSSVSLKQARVGRSELAKKLRATKPPARIIYQFLNRKRKWAELFRSAELRESLGGNLQLVEREMIQLHLMKSAGEMARSMSISMVILIAMLLPGLTKLCLGIIREKPVFYLVVLLSDLCMRSAGRSSPGRASQI